MGRWQNRRGRSKSATTPLRQRHKGAPAARPLRQSDRSGAGHSKLKQRTVERRVSEMATSGKRRSRSPDSSTSVRESSTSSERKSRPLNSNVRRRRSSNWDVPPTSCSNVVVQQNLTISRKTREVYVGNLAEGRVTQEVLLQAFKGLFHALPAFRVTYPDVSDPVRSMAFPSPGKGMFAFVEFFDEV